MINYIFHSNIINFIIVLAFFIWLLFFKLDIVGFFGKKSEETVNTIKKSENKKADAIQHLAQTKSSLENVDIDVREIVRNAEELANGAWRCDLLVGYENMKTVEGIVPLTFDPAPVPSIDGERAVQVLAQITLDSGRISLKGKSVYQPLMGKELPKRQ